MERELASACRQTLHWLQEPIAKQDLEKIRAAGRALLRATRFRRSPDKIGKEPVTKARECTFEPREKAAKWVQQRVRFRDTLHGAPLLLWILAAGGLGYWVFARSANALSQAALARSAAETRATSASPSPQQAGAVAIPPGAPLGMIEIPRLGVFAIVTQGDGPAILGSAVGHVPGTALPGQSGRSILVGRYDTFLHDLDKVRPGDMVTFIAPDANIYYRVERTRSSKVHSFPPAQEVGTRTDGPDLVLNAAEPSPRGGGAERVLTVVARQEIAKK